MDLEGFVANRELLERLSREYELLKASGAVVDYAAWVRQRLREAAAQLAVTAIIGEPPGSRDTGSGSSASGASQEDGGVGAGASDTASDAGPAPQAPQLAFSSRFSGSPPHDRMPRPTLEVEGDIRPETAWFLRGEGTGAASQALASAIYGPTATQGAKAGKKHKRVVIVSPQRSPTARSHASSPARLPRHQQQQAVAPISKLYTRQEPGLFTSRPDASVHPQPRPRRASPASKRPDWVNAASLQAALRSSSSAVPHLQAAAGRERRLALSSVLARQTLAAGLSPDDARAAALYGVTPGAAAASAAQYDHVLQVAAQLAAQNEQLARAVQENSAALAAQQVVLQSALQPRPDGGVAADAAPARVEVEAGPPAWFSRRGATAGGGGPAGKGATAGRAGSKSPAKRPTGAARSVSPSALPPAGTTSKERDRATRKEALKTLLRQVLGGAGLAGGEDGQRRLASSMAEAEKLVAAIQALARIKGGKGKGRSEQNTPAAGAGDNAAAEEISAAAVAASRPTAAEQSFGHGGGAGNAEAGLGSRDMSRQVSAAASRTASMRTLAIAVAAAAAREGAEAGSDPAAAPQAEAGAWPPGRDDAADPATAGRAVFDAAAGAVAASTGAAAARGGGAASAAAAQAGGHAGGQPPGVMVESLEDQVQQVVERDAAMHTEAARFRKIDALEQRLHSLVDKVETKLARVLGPLSLNIQQLQAGGLLGPGEWEVVLGPDGKPLLGADGRPLLRPKGAGAGAAAVHAGAGGEGPLSPRSAGLSVLELQRMLITLNRMESKEAEVRRRWFFDPRGPLQRAGPGTLPIYVRDGHLGNLDPDQPQPGPEAAAASASAPGSPPRRPPPAGHPRSTSTSPNRAGYSQWRHFPPQPPTETVLGTIAADSSAHTTRTVGVGGGASGGVDGSTAAQDGSGEAALAGADPVSEEVLESVTRGRRRFLRAQQLADGDLVAAAEPSLNPVQVMEDVADVLLDDMLREHAKELLGMCDQLGEQIYRDEFDLGSDDEKENENVLGGGKGKAGRRVNWGARAGAAR